LSADRYHHRGRLRLAHRRPADGVADVELLRRAALTSRAQSGDPLDLAVIAEAGTKGIRT
jgi:hypothetical protein